MKPTLPPAVQTTQASPVKPVVVLQTLVAVGGLADADLINTRAIAVMARRIQDLGEGPSGASSYYADRVRQAAMLTNYEIKLAQYFLDSPTKFANYYEIGSGASTFPVLLAANCMPATGIEIDSRRHAAALDILQDLQAEFARQSRSLPATCTLLRGGVPAILEALDLENSVGIVTNLTTSISVQQRLDFIRSLLKFPVVILDVQRFVTRQTTPGTEDALVAELVLAGFTKPEIILDLGSNGRYFRLAGRGGLTSAIVMPATHVAA